MVFDLFYFLNIVCSFLVSAYLLIRLKPKNYSLHTKSLAGYLFFNGFCFGFYLLIKYKFILNFPYLYKIAAPITYLIMPAAYFHVKSIISKKTFFRRKDLIHLFPFFVFLVSYLPFYYQDLETKRSYVALILQDPNLLQTGYIGLLPEAINNIGRLLQPIVYILLQWQLLKSSDGIMLKTKQEKLYKWLLSFVKIQTFFFIFLTITVFSSKYFSSSFLKSPLEMISLFLTVGSFFVMSIYLLWNQNILQKMKYFNPFEANLNINNHSVNINSISKIVYDQKYFMGKENDLVGVSRKLGITKTELSQIISSQYDNFNSWINTIKIKQSIELMKKGFLNDYSIEALASSCGFNSVNTFYRAFKKQTGVTPKLYADLNL